MLKSLLLVIICVSALCSEAPAQTRSAISAEARQYRFDLARNLFSSLTAEARQRAQVLQDAAALQDLSARLHGATELAAALELHDRMLRQFRRHDLYLFLRYATDIRRESELGAADQLRAPVRAARLAFERALLEKDDAWLEARFSERPELAGYRSFIASLRRTAAHALSGEEEAVVSSLEPLLGAGDYPRVVNALQFESINVDGRALNALRDRAEIETHPSHDVRREGSRLVFAGYAQERELLAFMLVRAIEGADALARLHRHESAEAQAAFEAYVSPSHYEAALSAIAEHGDYYKSWQRQNADPLAGEARWPVAGAVEAIVASAGPLGERYQREFAALLDRRNGRADLGEGPNRLPLMGTASVYPIGTSAVFMQAYEGRLLDLVVVAHEGGHAVQAQLMFGAGVPMAYAAGPGYFTESFGRFQELLLLDHLYRNAGGDAARTELRDALAARLMAMFPSAEEAAVELAIHRGVRSGAIRTADQIDAAALAAGSPFSLEYERTPERRGIWMMSEGYFMAPMQELNDAYASLLAVRYFELYRRDPHRFRAGYLALLSGGYNDAPSALLQRHVGLDMMAPGFVAETMARMRAEVDALYR